MSVAAAGRGRGRSLKVLMLVVSLALGAGVRPCLSAPDGEVKAAEPFAAVSDAQLFTRELMEGGALRFYDATEELLRAAQFERALLRYQFLRGQIHRRAAYRPLAAQVDHRLRFLKGQLKLGDTALASLPLSRPRPPLQEKAAAKPLAATPPPKIAPNKADNAAAAAGQSDRAEKVPPSGPSPPAAESLKETPPPAGGVSPPGKQAETAAGQAGPEAKEKAAEETPPAPPLSRWDKVKRRLLFWKKKEV